MKKIMTIASVALAGAAFAAVESENIVGYGSTTLAANTYYMVAAQFDDVSGTGAGMALNDLVSGVPYNTELSILKPTGGYDIYKYIEEAYDATTDEFVPGWGDGGDNLATVAVAPGTTFWLKAPSACSATIAGQLLADSSKSVTVAAGTYSMIGNPYPVAVNPNTLTWTGLTYNDELSVLKSTGGYDIYKYLEEAYDASKDDFVPGWGDGLDNLVATEVIPVGQGAWIKPAAAVTIEWTKPL